MGLYLCVFDGDEELDGVEVGSYEDYAVFRNAVRELEGGKNGSRFPVLMLHADCDGRFSPEESLKLEEELEQIGEEFQRKDALGFSSEWQRGVARTFGLRPITRYDDFIDVDGEPLVERLIGLCKLSQQRGLPILFQ